MQYPTYLVCCANIRGSMKMPLHIIVLFLFVTTQCFAPFVHAHVDGIQDDASFHAHDIRQYLSSSDLSQCHVESQESQAIGIPHGYPLDDALVILDIVALSAQPVPPCITRGTFKPHDTLRLTASAYHRPHTQAPPASVRLSPASLRLCFKVLLRFWLKNK